MILVLRRAFAANIVPAVALWSLALLLLALYFTFPPARAALNEMAALKARLGWIFSLTAQAIAAGLLPFFFQRFQRGDHRRLTWAQLPFLLLVRGAMGVLTDEFYTLQAHLFGDSSAPTTILLKTAVDMLIYTPFIVLPLVIWTFGLMDNNYALDRARGAGAGLENQTTFAAVSGGLGGLGADGDGFVCVAFGITISVSSDCAMFLGFGFGYNDG